MKKLIIGGVVLLVIAAVVIVAMVNLNGIVNRNKEFLLSRAEQSIGRAVSVEKIAVTLRGGVGVRLTNVKLADDPAFSKEYFIEAEDLQINAKLLPLLRKRFEVKKAILHAPVIRIIRDENGVMNFNSMTNVSPDDVPGSGEAGAAGTETSPLVIALIDLDNGTIEYEDRQTKSSISITRVDTRIEDLDSTKPLALELKAALFSDEQNIAVKGRTGPVGGKAALETVPIESEIAIDKLDLTALKNALPALASRIPPKLKLDGAVSASVRIEGTIPALKIGGTLDGTSLSIEQPGQFAKQAGIPLRLEFSAHRDQDNTVIDSAGLTLDTVHLTGSGTVRGGTPPGMVIDAAGQNIDLSALGSVAPQAGQYALAGKADFTVRIEGANRAGVPPDVKGTAVVRGGSMKSPQLLKPVTGIEATIAFTGSRASISGANMMIGGSAVVVDAEIESFEPLRVSYKVRSPELALTDVRPPNLAARKPEHLKQAAAEGTLHIIGASPVNSGAFTARQGSIANIDFTELEGQFALEGNQATFKRISLKTMGGSATGSGTAVLDPVKPSFAIQSKITGAEISLLLGTIPALEKNPLKGSVNLNADISGSGKEWNDIKKTINGTGLTEILKGKILKFNFIDQLFVNLKQYPGFSNIVTQRIQDKYPKAFKSEDTEFNNWNSDFVVEEGKLKARNLVLFADNYTLKGQGFLDFDKVLDLDITLLLSPDLSKDLAAEVGVLKYFINAQGQLEVPMRLKGTLPKVTVMPNQEYIQRTLQQGLLQQGVDKLKDKGLKDLLPKIKKRE
jgi:uncharacterized protein involved in outer membrane biogenesis